MPIYEFICNACGEEFETITSAAAISEVTCEKCSSPDVKKVLSTTSFKMGASIPSLGSAGGGCTNSGFS